MTTATYSDILASVDSLAHDAQEQFQQLARQLCAGENVEPFRVAEILKAADKSTSDLRQLVELHQRRARLREELVQADESRAQVTKLRADVEKQNVILEAAVAAHREVCWPIQAQISALESEANATGGHSEALFNTCPCPSLHHQLREVSAAITAANRRIGELQQSVERAQAQVYTKAWRSNDDERNRIDAEVTQRQGWVAATEDERARLIAEQSRIVEAMRSW